MRLRFPKLAAFILLFVFLLTSSNTVFACSLCGAKYITNIPIENKQGASVITSDERSGTLCFCSNTQQCQAVSSSKRLNRDISKDIPIVTEYIQFISSQHLELLADNSVPQPPPIVSQTIRAHRTIVLLN
jgi:hypothetical protein